MVVIIYYRTAWDTAVIHYLPKGEDTWRDLVLEEIADLGCRWHRAYLDVDGVDFVLCDSSRRYWDNPPPFYGTRNYHIEDAGSYVLRDGRLKPLARLSDAERLLMSSLEGPMLTWNATNVELCHDHGTPQGEAVSLTSRTLSSRVAPAREAPQRMNQKIVTASKKEDEEEAPIVELSNCAKDGYYEFFDTVMQDIGCQTESEMLPPPWDEGTLEDTQPTPACSTETPGRNVEEKQRLVEVRQFLDANVKGYIEMEVKRAVSAAVTEITTELRTALAEVDSLRFMMAASIAEPSSTAEQSRQGDLESVAADDTSIQEKAPDASCQEEGASVLAAGVNTTPRSWQASFRSPITPRLDKSRLGEAGLESPPFCLASTGSSPDLSERGQFPTHGQQSGCGGGGGAAPNGPPYIQAAHGAGGDTARGVAQLKLVYEKAMGMAERSPTKDREVKYVPALDLDLKDRARLEQLKARDQLVAKCSSQTSEGLAEDLIGG